MQHWQWQFVNRPLLRPLASRGPSNIVHLYSGRRRHEDVQNWMEFYVDQQYSHFMNIYTPLLWNKLLDLARGGRLLALLFCPPCQSWSAARFHSLQSPDDALPARGPCPLRLAVARARTLSELLQLSVGSCLPVKGIWLL
eukprot:s526_g29.t1